MNDMTELSEFQMDSLKELGNIGSAHAATSLSIMVGHDIDMRVPEIEIAPLEAIGSLIDPDEKVVGIYFQLIDGDSKSDGHIYLLFPEQSAYAISDMLMCNEKGTTKEITELEKSALMEVGNVLISSFGDASAELLGITMLPSTPTYRHDMARNLIIEIVTDLSKTTKNAILFKTAMTNESNNVNGYLMLLPEPKTLENMLMLLGAKVNG